MIRLRAFSWLFGIALAAGGIVGCKSNPTAPTGFGVDITVNARALSPAARSSITNGELHVADAETVTKKFDVQKPIQTGELRFRFVPAATVKVGDMLALGFDALDKDDKVVASGAAAAEVTLKAGNVNVTITLEAATGDGGTGKSNGTACVAGTECGTGFCADGVCCNEKCDDVCVSCNLTPTKGMCTPYAADTDPAKECGAKLPPMAEPDDAGSSTTDATADAAASSNDAAAGSSDAEPPASDAAVINTPDGGLMSMPNACAGACNGARACKFPDKTKSCGTPFCNTKKEVAAFVCDGNGGCGLDLSICTNFTCDDTKGSCRTQCAEHGDCQLGLYCDGATHNCVDKKAISLTCVTDAECKLDHCSTGICCNTQCDSPFTCNSSGSVGQCKCPGVMCATGVACQVFYQDADGDGFGNKFGVPGAMSTTAKAGCAGMPPAGYVVDNTDCDDGDPNVHPGQTAFFGAPSLGTPHTFDYNCDGTREKQTPEYPGGSCKFCGALGTCDQTTTTCTSVQTGSFACPQEPLEISRLALPAGSDLQSLAGPAGSPEGLSLPPGTAAAAPGAAAAAPGPILPPPICKVCIFQCCGCHAADKTGFTTIGGVACGAVDTLYTCGACAAVGGGAAASTRVLTRQFCR
jgi:hypothetical protein